MFELAEKAEAQSTKTGAFVPLPPPETLRTSLWAEQRGTGPRTARATRRATRARAFIVCGLCCVVCVVWFVAVVVGVLN